MERESLEKMRLVFILSVTLVFGVVLQQVVFSGGGDAVAKQDEAPQKVTASVVEIFSEEQTQGDISVTEDLSELTERLQSTQEAVATEEEEETTDSVFLSSNTNPNFLPIRDHDVLDITLETAASMVISEDGKILHQENIDEKRNIASLTKVVVAVVVLENLDLNEIVTINQAAIDTDGIAGRFNVGDQFGVEELLKIMLVVSSNDSAGGFNEHFKLKGLDMVELMNKKVEELGLSNTHFSNYVGFDEPEHYSTARDYANLILYSLKHEKLWEILSIKDEIIKPENEETPDKRLISSNKLMFGNLSGILGGKTGYTPEAGGCLMTVFESEGENGRAPVKIVAVLLGADDINMRFSEMERLIEWVRGAYIF